MKVRPFLIIAISVFLALALTAGVVAMAHGQQTAIGFHPASDSGASTERTAWKNLPAIGLVASEDGVADMSYNWLSWQGVLRAESELGVEGTVYTATNPEDYEAKLQECANDGNDLCISVGYVMELATGNVATANPGTYFSIVDGIIESDRENLRGIGFARKEVAYLAGTLAGLMSQSDVVGDIGGPDYVPAVVDLVEGYRNGAQCANPEVDVLTQYIWDWWSPELGAEVAQDMIRQGADVIFAAAGETGEGAVMTTTQSDVWGIGVDTDWYISVFDNGVVDGSDKLLSSAMNRSDNAVFDTISDVISGTFTSGTVIYNLEEDGVGLAPFHEADVFVSPAVRNVLENVAQGIINGSININDPCFDEKIYLPLVVR